MKVQRQAATIEFWFAGSSEHFRSFCSSRAQAPHGAKRPRPTLVVLEAASFRARTGVIFRLPNNSGRKGIIPTGNTGLTGVPRGKQLELNGNSGFDTRNFEGSGANDYRVTINGTGDSRFFRPWSGCCGGLRRIGVGVETAAALSTESECSSAGAGRGVFRMSAGVVRSTFLTVGQSPGSEGSLIEITGGLFSNVHHLDAQRGTVRVSGGVAHFGLGEFENGANGIEFDRQGRNYAFRFELSGEGVVRARRIFNLSGDDAIDFASGSAARLEVAAEHWSAADVIDHIDGGFITIDGLQAQPDDFKFEEVEVAVSIGEETTYTQVTLSNKRTCFPTATSACLNEGRFRAEVSFVDHVGNPGIGQVAPFGTDESAIFTFFAPENLEILVKVLRGCEINDRFWVFTAGLTNVEYEIKVTDTLTGATMEYLNEAQHTAETVTDTDAFVCN